MSKIIKRYSSVIILVVMIIVTSLYFNQKFNIVNINYDNKVSNVELLDYEDYEKFNLFIADKHPFVLNKNGDKKNVIGSKELSSSQNINFMGEENSIDMLYYVNPQKNEEKRKFNSLAYAPKNDTYFSLYDMKNPMILTVGFDLTPEDTTNDNVYVEFGDGSCYYPVEFEKENDSDVCQGYLEETVDYLGYEDIDNMLLEVFGDAVRLGE